MHAFETILAVLLGAVLLSLVARRLKAPFPPFLALGGAAVAFLPFAPEMTLDPELVLALFVAPILLDSSFDSSPRDLKRNIVPITLMSLAAVGITVVAVALTARHLEPEMGWAVAIALGAIVAPPDAAAATAVLRAVPVPYRIRTILEGESLFNDASSLLTYRLALTAALGGMAVGWGLAATIVWALVGSVVFAMAVAWITTRLTRGITDAPAAILIQFIGTFGLWIAAEKLGLSAIVTVVVYGLTIARLAARNAATIRAPAYTVWDTVVFALNAMAFALVGLQIGPIWRGLEPAQRGEYALFAVAVLIVAVLARLVWVMGYNTFLRLKNHWFGVNLPEGVSPPTPASGVIIGWAGMRGVVSLAAAYALPMNFPHRDLLLLATFAVVMGTLVVQGLTLGPLIKLLRVEDDGLLEREIKHARQVVTQAAVDHLKGCKGRVADRLKDEYDERLDAVMSADADEGRVELESDQIRDDLLTTKRDALMALRTSGEIGEAAYYQIEEELDRYELSWTPVVR
ncbi:cation:proton antiporter [Brevundimonas goettingensis]|uniref:Sodium:proton antiporter n=1 Tax=Brevundimonas goettingensis TaxID=2774190 RepID=A0A975C6D3_9CAUL|nr:sodium:proton antiporter [Brevundimonas goettingensis]QTC92091.1 sodium:proton antiporter [Brevundimonas goettingensis]